MPVRWQILSIMLSFCHCRGTNSVPLNCFTDRPITRHDRSPIAQIWIDRYQSWSGRCATIRGSYPRAPASWGPLIPQTPCMVNSLGRCRRSRNLVGDPMLVRNGTIAEAKGSANALNLVNSTSWSASNDYPRTRKTTAQS
jgi:hypothetical protein